MIRSLAPALRWFLVIGILMAAGASDAARRPLRVAEPPAANVQPTAGAARAARDSIVVFGGPGTLEGKFEHPDGSPGMQDWQGVDHTETDALWQMSTFNAADLDPDTPGNHAWWCGNDFESCDPDDPAGGYGNNWRTSLVWSAAVADPSQPVTVHLTAVANIDTELGYDVVFVEVRRGDEWETLELYDGEHVGVVIDQQAVVAPGDLVDGEVGLRFRVDTDLAWSDEDCLFPTAGAMQVDNIAVTFDQGDGAVMIGEVETAEPGATSAWTPEYLPGVGDYAKIWADLEDIDPCRDHTSPVLAFIDDGEVVPGTGGSSCEQWCYGPGGYIVNPTGGLAGDGVFINNRCWSPPIALPGDPVSGALLEFDNYMHNSFTGSPDTGVFMVWYIDSTADPAGETGWSGPRSENFLYEGGPAWIRRAFEVGDLLVDGARWVRIGLGVIQVPIGWGGLGTDGTPAPYFDNVRFTVFPPAGPDIDARYDRLARDAFPSAGEITPGALDQADVPVDGSDLIGSWNDPMVDDLVRVAVEPVRDGVLVGRPELHYAVHTNPVFDPYRDSGWPSSGTVAADSVGGFSPFVFDLPDEGFLFPGDVMHYCITASQVIGGQLRTAVAPADTSGFGDFRPYGAHGGAVYASRFTVRALPSIRTADTLEQPRILIYDRSDASPEMDPWHRGLASMGLQEGVDYDVYRSQTPYDDDVNCLGYRSTLSLLTAYETIIVPAGYNEAQLTGPDQDPHDEPYNDTPLIRDWLLLGDRTLILGGDNAVNGVVFADHVFAGEWLGAQPLQSGTIPGFFDGQFEPPVVSRQDQPLVLAMPGYRISACRGNSPLSALSNPGRITTAVATTGTVLAEFTAEDHVPGTYLESAVIVADHEASGSRVISVNHSLARVLSDRHHGPPDSPLPASSLLVGALLELAGEEGISVPVAAPDAAAGLALSAYPNPFNPRVTLQLALPVAGRTSVDLFDVRGRLVRRLVDGELPAGVQAVVWDGTDDRGRHLSAGLYVARLRSGGEDRLQKLVLLK
ncbi:hypothetical protein GF314_15025 [bacterium]|nr:hypothetical protein [bacterium]